MCPAKNVIIDTDCGVDDFVAIVLALRSQLEVRVVAVTAIGGNAPVDRVTENCAIAIDYCYDPNRPGIVPPNYPKPPVYRGADSTKLGVAFTYTPTFHGPEGLPPEFRQRYTCRPPAAGDAWSKMHDLAKSTPITIVAIGPLTNVFHLLQNYPHVAQRIDEVIVMGDAVYVPVPSMHQDVSPIVGLLAAVQPEVVSVALDPEGAGPDTHYKSLQAINEAIQQYAHHDGHKDLRVIGYRNVWHRFHPSEADLFVPVTLGGLSCLEHDFLNAFSTQRLASFPSYEHDEPFCELAERIQYKQFQMIRTCLGPAWFEDHSNQLFRATRGLVFLREMDVDDFCCSARRLQEFTVGGSPRASHLVEIVR